MYYVHFVLDGIKTKVLNFIYFFNFIFFIKAVAKSLMELAPRLEFFQQQSVSHFPIIEVLSIVQV